MLEERPSVLDEEDVTATAAVAVSSPGARSSLVSGTMGAISSLQSYVPAIPDLKT